MRGIEGNRATARRVIVASTLGVSFFATCQRASAATVYWDPISPATSPAVGGSGTWTASDSNWRTNASDGSQTTWVNGDAAQIGDVSGSSSFAVTLGSDIIASRITFTSDRYTLSGPYSLTVPIVQTYAPATIAATLAGTDGLQKYGVSDLTLSGANSYSGVTRVLGGKLRVSSGTGGGNLGNTTGIVADYGATLWMTNAADTSIGAAISGDGRLFKSGTATLTLGSNSSSYTGGTTIYDGTVRVTGGGALGAATGTLTMGDTLTRGTLSYEGGSTSMGRAITLDAGGGQILATGAATTLTLAGAVTGNGRLTVGGAGSVTISSAMSHTGGLTKNDAGTLRLSGANTYSGTTLINQGTLLVSASTAAQSSVSLANGATLGGTGTVNGPVVAHGAISPGNSAGQTATLTTGSTTWSADGTYRVDITSAGASDLLVMSGLTQQAGYTVSVNSAAAFEELTVPGTYSWEIARISTAGSSFDVGAIALSLDGPVATGTDNAALVDQANGDGTHSLVLSYVVVPEPASLLAAGLLAMPIALRRRRTGKAG